jgi:hypothetical protein
MGNHAPQILEMQKVKQIIDGEIGNQVVNLSHLHFMQDTLEIKEWST